MTSVVFGVGYVGSRLVQELLYGAREVVGVDNLFATDRRAIDSFGRSPGFRFVEGSIVDPVAVGRAFDAADEVEAIYLLAAQASAHPAAASAEYTEETNLRGPRIVLDAVARRGITAPVVYASSTRVYGSPLPAVVDEATPYGTFADLSHLSKCYAEKLLEMYAVTRGVVGRVVRLGLTYGVAPVLKTDPRFATAPNWFCLQAARGERLQVRSTEAVAVIHADDAVAALFCAAAAGPASYAVFNAATAVVTIPEVAEVVREVAAARDVVAEIDWPARMSLAGPRPVVHSALGPLGFVPRRALTEGLAETFDHFLVRGQ